MKRLLPILLISWISVLTSALYSQQISQSDRSTLQSQDPQNTRTKLDRALSTNEYSEVAAKSFFVEFLGPSYIVGFNFDTRLTKRLNGIGARAGLGYMSFEESRVLSIPVAINYLLGKQGKYFEIGAGFTVLSFNDDSNSGIPLSYEYYGQTTPSRTNLLGNLVFGYRKQPVSGGFMFRAGLSPVFGKDGEGAFFFFPYLPYISFGYTF